MNNFKIYPNPNKGTFQVELELLELKDIHLKVYNAIGQQVYSSNTLSIIGAYKQSIILTRPHTGIYFVIIDVSGQKLVRRFGRMKMKYPSVIPALQTQL